MEVLSSYLDFYALKDGLNMETGPTIMLPFW